MHPQTPTAPNPEDARSGRTGHEPALAAPSTAAADSEPRVATTHAAKHLPALDGIRGLAIAMVLLLHFVGNTEALTRVEQVVVKAARYGTYGVDLFFVLSGFLITGILIDAKGKPGYFRNFYARRTLRIFPLYYGMLVLLWLWPAQWSPPDLELAQARQGWLWGYVANFLVAREGSWAALPYFNHFWSLSVEEHFYLIWPLLVFRSSRRGLMLWAGGLSLAALVLRVGLALAGTSELVPYTITPARLDGLCLGGMVAVITRREGGLASLKRHAPKICAAVGVYLIVGYVLTHRLWQGAHAAYFQGRESGALLLCGALLVFVLSASSTSLLSRFFRSRVMTTLGKYSYGLYVFHAMLSWYLAHNGTEHALAAVVGSHGLAVFLQASAGIACSFLLALISFHFYEKPFLSLKSRFETSR